MSDVVLDAHVHFHRGYSAETFFSAAAANFAEAGGDGTTGVLFMAESADCDWFGSLTGSAGEWEVLPTEEYCSRKLTHPAKTSLYIIAGHQVVTTEGIEVLVVGTCDKPADGGRVSTIIENALSQDFIAIIPWGIGKWLFNRGTVVQQLIEHFGQRIFLGDNAGRLRYAPYPPLLAAGERAGLRILPGTDPLPMTGEELRVGGFGTILDGCVEPRRPFRSLKALLSTNQPGRRFGTAETLGRFARHQLHMQLKKIGNVLP